MDDQDDHQMIGWWWWIEQFLSMDGYTRLVTIRYFLVRDPLELESERVISYIIIYQSISSYVNIKYHLSFIKYHISYIINHISYHIMNLMNHRHHHRSHLEISNGHLGSTTTKVNATLENQIGRRDTMPLFNPTLLVRVPRMLLSPIDTRTLAWPGAETESGLSNWENFLKAYSWLDFWSQRTPWAKFWLEVCLS